MTKKQFTIYMICAFAIAWIIQVISSVLSLNGNQLAFQLLTVVTMYIPFLSVLIARIPLKEMGWIPRLKGKIIYIFVGLWFMSFLMIIGAGIFFLIFPKAFDAELKSLEAALVAQAGEQALSLLKEQGLTLKVYLVISIIQALTYAPFLNMFVALGEEVGWRGAMTPYLKDKLGKLKGRIAAGTIWGVWHWPLMIIAGYEYGTDYFGAPILGPIVFCLFAVFVGVIIDDLYERTSCIWFPALMHGAINAFSSVFPYLLKPEYERYTILGPAYNGLISMIPLLIAGVFIMVNGSRTEKEVVAKEQ